MSNPSAHSSHKRSQNYLAVWLHKTLSHPGMRMRCRMRGNILYLLFEGDPCPDQQVVTYRVLQGLNTTDINTLVSGSEEIYQVWLYGRSLHQHKPSWTFRINLDQLGHYLHHFTVQPPPNVVSQGVDGKTHRQHASQTVDETTIIARRLSETLSQLGVSVAVRAKALSHAQPPPPAPVPSVSFPAIRDTATQRLVIACKAAYSPSSSLMADPIARQLRSLNLKGFRDAVVSVQVKGEEHPDWTLRIDLTPTELFLREWAQWGDVAALSQLLNQALASAHATIGNASQKDTTLHLICEPRVADVSNPGDTSLDHASSHYRGDASQHNILQGNALQVSTLDAQAIKAIIHPLLDDLDPQGIQAVVVYGHTSGNDTPDWVEYLPLSTSDQPEKAIAPLELAQQGNLEAIAYLLSRLLNPDLNTQLATGGIRVQLLAKDGLLHVMCDASICPRQEAVSFPIIRLLQQVKIPNITGIRIYGRRSGLRSPLWSYGTDFATRPRFVPEPEPEFAATDAYVNDLVSSAHESPLREDLTPAELWSRWSRFWQRVTAQVQRSLLSTQLVAMTPDTPSLAVPASIHQHGIKTAAIWAAVGILSVVQVDWILGYVAQRAAQKQEDISLTGQPPQAVSPLQEILPQEAQPRETVLSDPNREDNPQSNISSMASDFPVEDGATSGSSLVNLMPTEADSAISNIQADLISESPYPTFNSDQLDLKLALYYQRLEESGPPDILVIGSSRAFRGIDPVVLSDALAELGYEDVDIFNFGVNGATAQVVELVVRRILVPEQLPKLILWADGARAFNGGREDLTYQGIAESEGYDLVSQGVLEIPAWQQANDQPSSPSERGRARWVGGFGESLTDSYQALDEWLSELLAKISTAHEERDRLKALIQDSLIPGWNGDSQGRSSTQDSEGGHPGVARADGNTTEGGRAIGHIDDDGFLPLDIRFDPVTYYENYARVPGNYDRDYANFQLLGRQTEALQEIIKLGESHQVPIVFVNMPLTDEYLDPYRMEHEQEFRQHMISFDLAHEGFVFRDLGELWLTEGNTDYYRYFSDPSHLNRYGAFEISKHIAQDPMIPWPMSNQ